MREGRSDLSVPTITGFLVQRAHFGDGFKFLLNRSYLTLKVIWPTRRARSVTLRDL